MDIDDIARKFCSLPSTPSRRAFHHTIFAVIAGRLFPSTVQVAAAKGHKKNKHKKKRNTPCKPLAEVFCQIPSPQGSCCDALTEECTSCGCCPEGMTENCCIGGG